METIVRYGNGVQTRFEVPGNTSRTVLVNGVVTAPASADFQSVTLQVAPGLGIPVEIDYASPTNPVTSVNYNPANVAITGGAARGLDVISGEFRFGQRLPQVMATPPVIGAASATTSLTGAVLVSAFEAGAFTFNGGTAFRGGVPPNGGNYPNYLGMFLGGYAGTTSASPVFIDFDIDSADATGRLELYFKGSAQSIRLAVQNAAGVWEYATTGATKTLAGDGSLYYIPVTMGAAGTYRLRVETSSCVFAGVNCFATDTVRGVNKSRRRYIVLGDSYSEPTVNDSTGAGIPTDGWVQKLAYLTGYEIWSSGSGGTGYVNPGAGGRQKFRDRLATDVIAFAPDGVILAGGINDSGFLAGLTGTEAGLCIDQLRAALPNLDVVVLSPFFPRTLSGPSTTNVLATRDAIQAAALSRTGARFIDLLSLPVPTYLGSWTSASVAATAANASSIQVASLPGYFTSSNPGSDQFYIYIADGSSGEIRKVSNISGTGPYTLSLSAALTYAHGSGVTVSLAGPQYMTGSGRQGTPTGVGNADRYTGADATHPTIAGHSHIAYTVASLWTLSLSKR